MVQEDYELKESRETKIKSKRDLMNKKILFVCIHNSCRSVMAESIFNAYSKMWVAESAGVKKAEKIDEMAKKLLEKRGLKVKSKPELLIEKNLDEYEMIITVCDEACVTLPFPKPVEKWNIGDPSGKEMEVYMRVFGEIARKVKDLIERLEEKNELEKLRTN